MSLPLRQDADADVIKTFYDPLASNLMPEKIMYLIVSSFIKAGPLKLQVFQINGYWVGVPPCHYHLLFWSTNFKR